MSHRLRQAVDRVHEVERQEALTTDPSHLAGSVQRKNREGDVVTEASVQLRRLEAEEVHEGVSHAEAVHPDDPRPGPVCVPQDRGDGSVVGLVGLPSVSPGLAPMGHEAAVEGDALVREAHGPPPRGLDCTIDEGRGGTVIGSWPGKPPSANIHPPCIAQLLTHPGIIGTPWEPIGRHGDCQQRLVHHHPRGEPERERRSRHSIGHLAAPGRAPDEPQGARYCQGRPGECASGHEPRHAAIGLTDPGCRPLCPVVGARQNHVNAAP